jgi:hypothetical protein
MEAKNQASKSPAKERKMTEKGFLHKSQGKIAADAFLAAHRQWLETGELALATTPILRKLDQGEILPTPALHEVQVAVMNHMVAMAHRKTVEAKNAPAAKPKNWTTTIFNAKGEVQTRIKEDGEVEDLIKGFDLSSDADRWADRRLVEGASDWYAEVTHAMMPIKTVILRDDAMARVFKKVGSPVMKRVGGTTSSLSFRPKAHEDRSRFSAG